MIEDSFWPERKKKKFSIFGGNDKENVETGGIIGLDRMARSNKLSPEVITDYAKIVLTNRLEILTGVKGSKEQYDMLKEKYAQIINLSGQYYDMVIVDLDKEVGKDVEEEILKLSDIIVALVPQRAKEINKIKEMIDAGEILKEQNTVIAIGKYMENTKYNAKNITRNILRKRDTVNTIPYNNLFFESSQEGTVIDLFLNFMRIKEKDENYNFVEEIKNLNEVITGKIQMLQMIK